MQKKIESYSETFKHRGALYHDAMGKYPDVRQEEFQCVLEDVLIPDGNTICDIPSGGGYIAPYLPKNCNLISVDFSQGFTTASNMNNGSIILSSPFRIPIKNMSVDTVISIAGVHHHEDQRMFYKNTHEILKTNGSFILADVKADSKVAYFLDNVVGNFNSTGHQGIYLSDNSYEHLKDVGFVIKMKKHKKFSWVFKAEEDICNFMLLFFDMKNISHEILIKSVDNILGIQQKGGEFHVSWSLMTFYCVKPE